MIPANNTTIRLSLLDPPADKAKRLAIRIGQGDAVAETEPVEFYSTGLKLILLKRTGSPQLAEDLCQDTFIIALQKLRAGKVYKPEGLAGFLRQVAVNLSIEHYRKEKRYVTQEDGIISLRTPHTDKKAEMIDHGYATKVLQETLAQLSKSRDREILHRFYLLDEDKSQICRALDLSASHFDRVLYRAKQRMRQLIVERTDLKAVLFGSLFDA